MLGTVQAELEVSLRCLQTGHQAARNIANYLLALAPDPNKIALAPDPNNIALVPDSKMAD